MAISPGTLIAIGIVVVGAIILLLEWMGKIFVFGRIISYIKKHRDLSNKERKIAREKEELQKEKEKIKDLIELKNQDIKGWENKLILEVERTDLNVSSKAPYLEVVFRINNFTIFDFTMQKAECTAEYDRLDIGKDQIVKTTKVHKKSRTQIRFRIPLPPGIVEDLKEIKERAIAKGGEKIIFNFSVYGEFLGPTEIKSFEKHFDQVTKPVPSYELIF